MQLTYSDEKGVDRLEKAFKELNHRLAQTNTFFNEKFDDLRKVIVGYDAKLINMATLDKVVSIQTGQKDMKYNIERELEMLQEHVKETKDKISELSKRFSNLEIAAINDQLGSYQPTTNINHHNQQHYGGNSGHGSNNQTSRNTGQFAAGTNNPNDKRSQNSVKKNQSPETNKSQQNMMMQAQSSPMSPLMRKRTRADQAIIQELEKKLHFYDEQFFNIEQKMDSLKKQLDDKITKEDVRKLTSDKITKEDLDNLIPNEEIMQERMKYLVRDEIENLQTKMLEQIKGMDNKIIRLRAELDIHSIQRQLERKANEDQVRSDFSNHEFKIGTLDRNIIRMATDFETFQLAINKLHVAIVELQEANRDVLLGKRTTNCLSCGKGGDTGQTVMGKDGRVYKGMDHKGSGFIEDQNIPQSQFMMYDNISPHLQQQQQHLSQNQSEMMMQPVSAQDFYQKMKPSASFYDSGPQFENNGNGLPTIHRKKNSYGNSYGLKNLASQAGIQSVTAINSHGVNTINTGGNQHNSIGGGVNNSFTASHNNKKKLPFGFQVQKEKKELFKVGTQRGKSSNNPNRPYSNRFEDNRPDSEQYRDDRRFNLNSTFEN